jgi:hypothetical protein
MQQIRTQPAGPKAFRLYATVRDTYRQELGEYTFAVYEALTYYVDPKTLQGAIPLKLLAQTIQSHPSTASRHLRKLEQLGLITITPQRDAFGYIRDVNVYGLDVWSLSAMLLRRPRPTAARVPECRRPGRRGTVLRFPNRTHTTPRRPKMPAQL